MNKNKKFILPISLSLIIALSATIIPLLVALIIDDILMKDEFYYGKYQTHNDFSGFKEEDFFYSSLSRHFIKAEKVIRIINYKNNYYQINNNYPLDKNYSIVVTNGNYYLKTNKIYKPIKILNPQFKQKINKNRVNNFYQLSIIIIINLFIIIICAYHLRKHEFILQLIKHVFLIIFSMIAIATLNFNLIIWILIPFIIIIILNEIFKFCLKNTTIKLELINKQLSDKFSEMIAGIKIIRIFNSPSILFEQFDNINKKEYKYSEKKGRITALKSPLIRFVFISTITIIYVNEIIMNLHIGKIIAFTIYLVILYNYSLELITILNFEQIK